jgi:hypothetical protein
MMGCTIYIYTRKGRQVAREFCVLKNGEGISKPMSRKKARQKYGVVLQ